MIGNEIDVVAQPVADTLNLYHSGWVRPPVERRRGLYDGNFPGRRGWLVAPVDAFNCG